MLSEGDSLPRKCDSIIPASIIHPMLARAISSFTTQLPTGVYRKKANAKAAAAVPRTPANRPQSFAAARITARNPRGTKLWAELPRKKNTAERAKAEHRTSPSSGFRAGRSPRLFRSACGIAGCCSPDLNCNFRNGGVTQSFVADAVMVGADEAKRVERPGQAAPAVALSGSHMGSLTGPIDPRV